EDVNGSEIIPARAAAWVAECERQHGWIPGRARQRALPVAVEDIRDLYAFNATVSEEEERRATEAIPELSRLLSSEDVEQLVSATRHLKGDDASLDSSLLLSKL